MIAPESDIYSKKEIIVLTNKSDVYNFTIDDEQKIINVIRSGNKQMAKKVFENIFSNCFVDEPKSMLLMKCVVFDFCSTLIKAYSYVNDNDNLLYGEDLLSKIMTLDSFNDISEVLLKEVEDICEIAQHREKESLVDAVDKYIYKNYQNRDLSLNMIAEAFHFNPVYLSNSYKKHKNVGLNKIITRVRMEKAKELLNGNRMYVSEISEKVGLQPKTFTKVFKKYFGVTPTEYKN
ncbi:MAG: AraC family transcriptional regulator [Erysipelotrichia bacterium]|nr:AraC family transcriptional regulator [Erysipelotrichia bacterium]